MNSLPFEQCGKYCRFSADCCHWRGCIWLDLSMLQKKTGVIDMYIEAFFRGKSNGFQATYNWSVSNALVSNLFTRNLPEIANQSHFHRVRWCAQTEDIWLSSLASFEGISLLSFDLFIICTQQACDIYDYIPYSIGITKCKSKPSRK